MKNNPLITVYITNYNYAKYLNQSIKSVLNQTYKNFELIIIDDGSNDDSIDIINSYEKLKNVKLIFQKRKGLNATNNVALSMAKGKYFIRLDADDFFEINALEKMVNIIDKDDDIVMVFPDYFVVDEENSIIRTVKRHNFENDVKLFDQPAHGACTLIRKKSLQEIGGYDEDFDRQDGYDLWLKVINNFKIRNINEPLFYYRFHNSNLTKDKYSLLFTRAKIKRKRVKKLGLKKISVEALIPIRGTSYEPLLNPMKKIGKKTLIEWTIDAAKNSLIGHNMTVATGDADIMSFIEKTYGDSIKIYERGKNQTRLNLSLEKTILDFLKNLTEKEKKPDAILILYLAYPFKQSWQIDEAIDTMKLFDVDIVDGVIPDNRVFYNHDGKGLSPLVEDGGFHMERNELYRRVGGIHLMKTNFFEKNKKMIAGKIGHIQFDRYSSFKIEDHLDWEIANTILSNNFNLKKFEKI